MPSCVDAALSRGIVPLHPIHLRLKATKCAWIPSAHTLAVQRPHILSHAAQYEQLEGRIGSDTNSDSSKLWQFLQHIETRLWPWHKTTKFEFGHEFEEKVVRGAEKLNFNAAEGYYLC